MTRLLIWCSGANADVLDSPACALVRSRYAMFGLAVLLTAVFSALAAAHFLSISLDLRPRLVLIVSALWTLMIGTLDRLIISTFIVKEEHTPIDVAKVAAPRFILATVIALTVSEPLMLRFAHTDINLQLQTENVAAREEIQSRIEGRFGAELVRLDEEEQGIQEELRENGRLVRQAYQDASDEADGIAGTGILGAGRRYQDKLDYYHQQLAEQRALEARSETELRRIRNRREELQARLAAEFEPYEETLVAADGFFRRHAALRRLMKDPEVGGAVASRVMLLRLLFLVLEILPVLAKTLGGRTAYDAEFERRHDRSIRGADRRRRNAEKDDHLNDEARDQLRTAARSLNADALKRLKDSERIEIEHLRLDRDLADNIGRAARKAWPRIRDRVPNEAPNTQDGGPKPQPSAGPPGDPPPAPPADYPNPPPESHPEPACSERLPARLAKIPAYMGAAARRSRGAVAQARERLPLAILLVATILILLSASLLATTTYGYWTGPCQDRECEIDAWMTNLRARTQVHYASGELLGALPGHPFIEWFMLPEGLIRALLATEDRRFWSHRGIDRRAVIGAAWNNALRRPRRGASTLTMQLARCLDREREMWGAGTWPGKVAESRIAYQIERRYSKAEILDAYVNCVEFAFIQGIPIRGVPHAAEAFFGKRPQDLSLAESALLVAVLKGPAEYNPTKRPERALARRNLVLRRLSEEFPEYAGAAHSAMDEELAIVPRERVAAPPPVLRLIATGIPALPRPETLVSTLQLPVQRVLDGTLVSLLGDIEGGRFGSYHREEDQHLVGGGLVMDARTGAVIAYTCGRPSGLTVQWDTCARGTVALSSVVKVFMLAAGLEWGVVRPDDRLGDLIKRLGDPENYTREICARSAHRRDWTIRSLVAASDNCFSVAVHGLLPAPAFHDLNDLGLGVDRARPATALGTGGISMLDLSTLVAGFANGGAVPTLRAVTDGTMLESSERRLPFRGSTIDATRAILGDVFDHGTGAAARQHTPAGARIFGKTGTAADNAELLIVGGAEELVIVLWVGHLGARRQIVPNATAGRVLAASWGRVAAAALESREGSPPVATNPLAAEPQSFGRQAPVVSRVRPDTTEFSSSRIVLAGGH